MSKRTKFKLLILAAALCLTAALFAGCSGELKVSDFLQQNKAQHQQVTYYSNGGFFNGTGNIIEKNIYYHVGDLVITDFDSINSLSIARENYVFVGWYYVELDAENKPIIETVMLDGVKKEIAKIDENRPLETNLQIPENTHLYVGAKWEHEVRLQYVLASDDPITISEGGVDVKKNKGDVIGYKNFYRGATTIVDETPVESSDSTFLQCFLDADCQIPAAGVTIQQPSLEDEDAQEKATVYVKYIKGIYTVVRTEADVRSMFNNIFRDVHFYIYNDITCVGSDGNGLRLTPADMSSITQGTIEGNGHTISNLWFEFNDVSMITAGRAYSIFGQLGASAEIKNLTLNNVTLNLKTMRNLSGLHFLCSSNDGANFENFEIRNAVLSVDVTGLVPNIQPINGVYQNWLFGGVSNDNDFAGLGEGKLTINGKKLIIKNEVVVDEPVTE